MLLARSIKEYMHNIDLKHWGIYALYWLEARRHI